MGRQAARGERDHRRTGQRLQRAAEPRSDDGRRPRLSPVDGSLRRRCACIDVWYASHHRGRHPRGGRGDRRAPGSGRRQPPGALRGHLQQGSPARRHARVRVADRHRRRPARHPRRSARRHARRAAQAARSRPREGLHRLPSDDAGEPARVPRALPVRRLRAQGRRRRQRRDALLHHRPAGSRRERPAHPAGQGGDGVGPGAVPRRRACTTTTASASSSVSS